MNFYYTPDNGCIFYWKWRLHLKTSDICRTDDECGQSVFFGVVCIICYNMLSVVHDIESGKINGLIDINCTDTCAHTHKVIRIYQNYLLYIFEEYVLDWLYLLCFVCYVRLSLARYHWLMKHKLRHNWGLLTRGNALCNIWKYVRMLYVFHESTILLTP